MKYTPDYLAGLFDGEGFITLLRGKRMSGRRKFTPAVGMSNNYSDVVGEFRRLYGGSINIHVPLSGRPVHRWQLKSGKKVKIFLEDFKRHIIIKRPQALILLQWLAYSESVRKSYPQNARYPESILDAFEAYRFRLDEAKLDVV